MKKLFFLVFCILIISGVSLGQATLEQRWAVSEVIVENGSTGNTVNIKLTWNDGNPGQTHGISSWIFTVTSTDITITNVSVHSSISSNFNISKTPITNGWKVNIWGRSTTRMLKDAGNGPASYLVAVVTFNAPATDGSYTITLNNAEATKRITSPPYTPSPQTFSNSSSNLTVNVATTPTDQVPTATPPTIGNTPNYPSGTTRKYGDINWDGFIDVSDLTAMADIVIQNYGNVTVNDNTFGGADNQRKFYEQPEGESPINYDNSNDDSDPDVFDAIISDVYRDPGEPDPGSAGNPEPYLNLMDLQTLEDAIANGAWPSYAISAIANKPAYKVNDNGFGFGTVLAKVNGFKSGSKVYSNNGIVKFDVFNPGTENSKIRVKFINNDGNIRGLQIEFISSALPKKVDVWKMPDASDLKISWARNEFNKIVILIYAEGGKYIRTGENTFLTIAIPNVTVEQVIASEPTVIASVNNLSEFVNFEVGEFRETDLPLDYMLYQNYPNPFNPGTEIRFDIPEYSSVKIIVWNVLGQKVKTLVEANLDPGRKSVKWDGRDEQGNPVGSGVYFYTMYAKSLEDGREFTMTRKAVLMK
ncbi:FlgD immunoglobulin-like domain containing protein [Candidatus Kryptobacter tengchongensis]|uniref:FlgD Ig-like domain-containing protein n=1 Tax=Kryptobacter tengchongensis TaxID=1643429 RepID=A0A656D6X1_KRYT1|nr:FlgD immunoglobulin-like domain containing protein [Candidatus Kryptobacter tengchongensis]CUT01779.1 FlgD Ig-like domain-containing protein [Candidatus Kryptobacter tengchongensis]